MYAGTNQSFLKVISVLGKLLTFPKIMQLVSIVFILLFLGTERDGQGGGKVGGGNTYIHFVDRGKSQRNIFQCSIAIIFKRETEYQYVPILLSF